MNPILMTRNEIATLIESVIRLVVVTSLGRTRKVFEGTLMVWTETGDLYLWDAKVTREGGPTREVPRARVWWGDVESYERV